MSRPVNSGAVTLRLPITAIVSILHRVSGVALFFGVGYLTWLLSVALRSEAEFNWVVEASGSWTHGSLIWLTLTAVIYHLFAGIRHLLMDLHLGESLKVSRISAWLVVILSAIASLGLLSIWKLI